MVHGIFYPSRGDGGLEAQMEPLLTCAGVEDSHCVDV